MTWGNRVLGTADPPRVRLPPHRWVRRIVRRHARPDVIPSAPVESAGQSVVGVVVLKDQYGEPERGGSEWEPIKILLEGDEDSNKTNTASNTRLRLTT
jgi:hypothetical protein